MENLKSNLLFWLSKRDSIYQLIVWIVTPIFFAFIPILAFLVYMISNGFFSYDFFTNGMFGLNTFFILAGLALIMYGLLSTGIVIFLVYLFSIKYFSDTSTKTLSSDTKYFAIITFIFNILFQIIILITFSINHYMVINLIGVAFSLHVGSLFFAKPAFKLFTLIFFIATIIFTMFNFTKATSDFIGVGMNNFNMGGKADVILRQDTNQSIIIEEGKLVLLSPNRIFLKTKTGIKIIARKNKVIEVFKNQ